MNRIVGERLQDSARNRLDLRGRPPSSATIHQPLGCAGTMRAWSWRSQR